MAVLLDTSCGELVIDLYCNDCPLATKNFLKLCKIKYYNGCLFHNVQQNYIAQTGDPTGTGSGGTSVYGMMYGSQATGFEDEIHKHRRHNKAGIVSMAGGGSEVGNRSQFFITFRGEDMEHLDDKHTVFGEIAEGFDTLEKLNNLYTDEDGRPFQDVRIRHTYILDDPFDDPPQLDIPPGSPEAEIPPEEKVSRRIPYEEGVVSAEDEQRTAEELDESIRRKEAESRAIVLEMTGDIPDAEVKPPAEVLFVCKLNPVTTDADLELIFSRFGPIKECAIIRDYKTGDSLNYAFIEFETEDAVLEAYEKMNNVLIDDRRIKVDFSQSVSKLWNKYLLRPHKQQKPGRDSDTDKKSAGMGRGRERGGDDGKRHSDPIIGQHREGDRKYHNGQRGHHSSRNGRSRSRERNRERGRDKGRERDTGKGNSHRNSRHSRSRSRDDRRRRSRSSDRYHRSSRR
mmetsp:Transcript_24911/g.36736  ORF Transcript_24911/g.36736 Transcript_24911/m.36736 type:complete len:455 (-) Transcript_24911:150-1514(-)